MMWVLLGTYYEEEDFGGFQMHSNVFLGLYDNIDDAIKAQKEAGMQYDDTLLVVPKVNEWNLSR